MRETKEVKITTDEWQAAIDLLERESSQRGSKGLTARELEEKLRMSRRGVLKFLNEMQDRQWLTVTRVLRPRIDGVRTYVSAYEITRPKNGKS